MSHNLRFVSIVSQTCVMLLLPFGIASAQNPQVRTLDEIVSYGLEHNHDLRAVRFSVDEANAASEETRSALLPAIRGEGNYTHLSSNIPDFELTLPPEFGGGDFSVPSIRDRYDFTVRVEQPVFTGLQLLNSNRAAKLNALARAADSRQSEADVAFSIRAAYWTLFRTIRALDVANASQSAIEVHLANTLTRREVGAALASDVLALQARLGETKLEVLNAQNSVRIARLRVAQLAGLPLDETIEPAEPNPIDWTPVEPGVLEQSALEGNAMLEASRLNIEALQAQTRAQQAGWFPQVFFVGLYQYARPNAYIFPQEDVFTGTWQVGLSARWDIWNWGQTRARTQQARYRTLQAQEQLESNKRAVQFAVREATMNVDHRRLAMSVAEQNVQQSEAAFNAMERRFDQGAALTSEVLDAELALRSARLQHATAVAEYGIAQAQLLRETGRVFEDSEPNLN